MSHAHGRLYDHSTDSPEQLLAYASEYYSHEYTSTHPAAPPADRYHWTYHPQFPLAWVEEHRGDRDYWITWLDTERTRWNRDGHPHTDDLALWWPRQPELYPIVIAYGSDGLWYTHDGSHRVALAYWHNLRHVPAVVGRAKQQRE